jgi:N-methylhydantoinase B/oxoprolinase/acetone carboxylase alpha subunit
MPFEAVATWLPSDADGDGDPAVVETPPVGVAPFSDDVVPRPGQRISLRVCVRDRPGGGYRADFSDSAPFTPAAEPFGLSPTRVRVATLRAFAHALDVAAPSQLPAGLVDVVCPASTWLGAAHEDPPDNPGAVAIAMSRVYDVVRGALGQAWPTRATAGSASLGAIVELWQGEEVFVEVVPGGEGGTPDRPGRHAWSGPILRTRTPVGMPPWLSVQQAPRTGSGGGGARNGGDGVIRRYRVTETVRACVAIDRVDNPPHGLDRAGPPHTAALHVESAAGTRAPAPRWTPFEIPAGGTLVVATCGGAGHGFPGYGDIEFDPGGWFGSKPSSDG